MWTSSLLKCNGRFVLRAHHLSGVLAALIRIACTLFLWERLFFSNLFPLFLSQSSIRKNGTYYFILCVSILLLLLARVLVVNPISVGTKRYFMEQRQGEPPFSTIFSIFTARSYWNVVRQMLLRDLQVFLFSLLLIVPGIYRAYQLRLLPWILAENPTVSSNEAFSLSTALVKDEKLSLLLLDLSFLGWFLLSCITCGIGFVFFLPYYLATLAESYAAYRAKAFALIDQAPQILTGFVCYGTV